MNGLETPPNTTIAFSSSAIALHPFETHLAMTSEHQGMSHLNAVVAIAPSLHPSVASITVQPMVQESTLAIALVLSAIALRKLNQVIDSVLPSGEVSS